VSVSGRYVVWIFFIKVCLGFEVALEKEMTSGHRQASLIGLITVQGSTRARGRGRGRGRGAFRRSASASAPVKVRVSTRFFLPHPRPHP
jgi:hypothetical protein